MRLFVALALSEAVRKELARIASALEPANPGVRWVPGGNYHLTLSFLGSVPDERVDGIGAALQSRAMEVPSGTARLDAPGAFPSPRRARVLWVGLSDADGVIGRLSAAVSETVTGAGFPQEDRPFAPHVTIGRRREAGPFGVPPEVTVEPLPVAVDRLTLFRSHLGRPAPRYEVVAAFPLG